MAYVIRKNSSRAYNDSTSTSKSRLRHSDADCLSRAPIDLPLQGELDDDAFLRTITADDFAEQQRADPELRSRVEYLEGKIDVVPRVFRRGLSYSPCTTTSS